MVKGVRGEVSNHGRSKMVKLLSAFHGMVPPILSRPSTLSIAASEAVLRFTWRDSSLHVNSLPAGVLFSSGLFLLWYLSSLTQCSPFPLPPSACHSPGPQVSQLWLFVSVSLLEQEHSGRICKWLLKFKEMKSLTYFQTISIKGEFDLFGPTRCTPRLPAVLACLGYRGPVT